MEVIFVLLFLGAIIVVFISWWKIFEKAGEAGWKFLVPSYNAFIQGKIAVGKEFAWAYLVACILSAIIPYLAIVALPLWFYLCFQLGKRFGKDLGFKILLCIPIINFFCVYHLAFNESCVYRAKN